MTKRIMEKEVTSVVFGSEIVLISMVRKIYCDIIYHGNTKNETSMSE